MRNKNEYIEELLSLYCNGDISTKENILLQLIDHLSRSLDYQESAEQCESARTQGDLKS